MTINAFNDLVELYVDDAGDHRWRRVDKQTRDIVSESSEGYELASYCREAAETYNSDLNGAAFVEV